MNTDISIRGFRLMCLDVSALTCFYEDALGAIAGSDVGDLRTLTLGLGTIELAAASTQSAYAPSNSTAFQHLAIIVSDMDAAMAQLATATGWTPISQRGPEQLPPASGGVTAFKFRDPEGHPLEFLAFPEGRPPDIWSRRDGLFLGIDHSAITVADVARSIAFYEGLGFTVSAHQINRGEEQARMDGLHEAVVDVVSLTPSGQETPHLELLQYRQPGTEIAHLADNDVLATRVLLNMESPMLSSLGFDPDGHRRLAKA